MCASVLSFKLAHALGVSRGSLTNADGRLGVGADLIRRDNTSVARLPFSYFVIAVVCPTSQLLSSVHTIVSQLFLG